MVFLKIILILQIRIRHIVLSSVRIFACNKCIHIRIEVKDWIRIGMKCIRIHNTFK
jgi:hypothetical protein